MQSVTFQEVESLTNIIREVLMDEWEAQGHKMTGKVINDLEFKYEQTADSITITGLMYAYANIIAAGVKKDRIPFSGTKKPGQGTGKTSLYIMALQEWVKNRMNINDDKEGLSIAFAIAKTQKKYGMPTPASVYYSKTGQRTDFIGQALEKSEGRISEAIAQWSKERLLVNLDVILSRWELELNQNN